MDRRKETMKNLRQTVGAVVWGVLAFLAVCYGIMIGSVNSGTGFFVIWFVIAALCGLCGLAVGLGWTRKIPPRAKTVCVVLLCVALAVFLVGEGCILSGFGKEGRPGLDYIIVLGAQVKEDGPGSILVRRLTVARDYLLANPETVCVVSGGQGSNEPWSEARGMADWLISNGIAAGRIVLEDASFSTADNLKNSRALIPADASVGIVTNNFHVFRSLRIAEKCGFSEAVGMSAGMSPWFLPHNMLREFFALVKYVLFS